MKFVLLKYCYKATTFLGDWIIPYVSEKEKYKIQFYIQMLVVEHYSHDTKFTLMGRHLSCTS